MDPVTSEPSPARRGLKIACFVLVALLALAAIGLGVLYQSVVSGLRTLDQKTPTGNESAGIGGLRTIATSEAIYREQKAAAGKKCYGTLAELRDAECSVPSNGSSGYVFEAAPGKDAEFTWWAVARPEVVMAGGDRVFFSNQVGKIYALPSTAPHASELPDPETCQPPPGAEPVPDRR